MGEEEEEGGRLYFEKQNERDCVIHSLNNAMGRNVINKQEVLEYIAERERELAKKLMEMGIDEKEVKRRCKQFRNKVATGESYFSAEIVWQAAKDMGRIGEPREISGYNGEWWVEKDMGKYMRDGFVVLGEKNRGFKHAIAVRGGYIYDSEIGEPIEYNEDNMRKLMIEIYSAYRFLPLSSSSSSLLRMGA
jgi:thioredoxin reductase